jgi:hypothetical protein
MSEASRTKPSQRAIWTRAATLGLSVGMLQVVINQGDAWLSHQVTRDVLIKSILSPLVTLSVALASAARTASEMKKLRIFQNNA